MSPRLTKEIIDHHLVYFREFEDGATALKVEKHIKSKFVGKDICPNGYTETLDITVTRHIINTIQSWE